MFIFSSDDREDGKERRVRFMIELIKYGAKLYKRKVDIAKYCGLNPRQLYNYVYKYDELKDLRWGQNNRRPNLIWDREHLWKTKRVEDL